MNTSNFITLALVAAMGATLAPRTALAHDAKYQRVTVTVDGSGYHPSTVSVKAGREVHMTFVSKGESCGNNVVIPALKKTLSLKVGEKKTISFTPQKGQTIAFVCSMKMFKGNVKAR